MALRPITGTTQILGVIGNPISHSLSPVMHNAALAALGVDALYAAFPVAETDLEAALAGFWATGISGFNVTIPHKQAVMPLLSQISPVAQAVGAVNTVWRTDQGWAGTNTDVAGFLAPLLAGDRSWAGVRAVVLGHGGAARAVVAGCLQLGCSAIEVVGRRPEALTAFADSWRASPLQPPLQVYPWPSLAERLPGADLLINTTPIGMQPHPEATPLPPGLIALLPAGAIAYDLIYTPRPTHLLRLAAERQLTTFDGLEMLVQQGAAALEIWLQTPAPSDIMRQALLQHLA
jgi:shikimate dehydrogenase